MSLRRPDSKTITSSTYCAQDGLLWRCWDGEHVVFNPLSGETHLLDSVAAVILRHAAEAQITLTWCVHSVKEGLGPLGREDVERYACDLLQQLEDLGLIRESVD